MHITWAPSSLECIILNIRGFAYDTGTSVIGIEAASFKLLGEVDFFIIIVVRTRYCQNIIHYPFGSFLGYQEKSVVAEEVVSGISR